MASAAAVHVERRSGGCDGRTPLDRRATVLVVYNMFLHIVGRLDRVRLRAVDRAISREKEGVF